MSGFKKGKIQKLSRSLGLIRRTCEDAVSPFVRSVGLHKNELSAICILGRYFGFEAIFPACYGISVGWFGCRPC